MVIAAAHRFPWFWLKNGPELHSACCKVNQLHVPAHSPALPSSPSVPRKSQGSCEITQREHIVPSATASTACILCFWQVDLSILIVITSILLVLLAIGPAPWAKCDTPYRSNSDTVWCHSACELLYPYTRHAVLSVLPSHAIRVTQFKTLFCTRVHVRFQIWRRSRLGQSGKSWNSCLLDTMKNKFSHSVCFQVFPKDWDAPAAPASWPVHIC